MLLTLLQVPNSKLHSTKPSKPSPSLYHLAGHMHGRGDRSHCSAWDQLESMAASSRRDIVRRTGGREITAYATHTWRLEDSHFWKPIKSGQGAASNCKSYTWKQEVGRCQDIAHWAALLRDDMFFMIRHYKIIMTGFIMYLLVVTFGGWGTGTASFTPNNTSIVGELAMYSLTRWLAWKSKWRTWRIGSPLFHSWRSLPILCQSAGLVAVVVRKERAANPLLGAVAAIHWAAEFKKVTRVADRSVLTAKNCLEYF